MSKDQAVHTIIDECKSAEGFLFELRANRVFDLNRYQKLADAIQTYHDAIGDDKVVDRRVAGCLFYLVEILGSQASYFQANSLPDSGAVTKAHGEIWSLVEKLYIYP